jgi:hypothetical protein
MCGSRRGGQFPSVEAELRAFPGVGRLYRAVAAIASAAAPVDGKIARIVARLTALEEPIARARRNGRRRKRWRRPSGWRFRSSAHGYRRNALPVPVIPIAIPARSLRIRSKLASRKPIPDAPRQRQEPTRPAEQRLIEGSQRARPRSASC